MLLVQITHLSIATALLVTRLLALQQLASAPPATSSVTTYDEETGEMVTVTTTAAVTLSSLLQARVAPGSWRDISNDQAQQKNHISSFPTTHTNCFSDNRISDIFTVFCEHLWKQFLYHPNDLFSYRLILSLPSAPSFFVRRRVRPPIRGRSSF